MRGTVEEVRGFRLHRGWLDGAAQAALVEALRGVAQAAPFVMHLLSGGGGCRSE